MTNENNFATIMEGYLKHEEERKAQGIPPLPLDPEQTQNVCQLLESPPAGKEDFLLALLKDRVAPGVDPSARVKADFLGRILKGEAASPLIDKKQAIEILGTMIGGYNVGLQGGGEAKVELLHRFGGAVEVGF